MPLQSILTYQPVKGIWVLLAVAFNAARIPAWILYYLPRFTRPNKNWTLRQAVRVRVVRAFLWNVSLVQMKIPMALTAGKEKERWVTYQPAKSEYYVGPAACDPEIKPVETGGTWYPAKPTGKGDNGYVVCHFHGGAYAIGDGRTDDAGWAAKTLLKNTDASYMFAPQYRLVSHPKSRFPAQLQDAISAYNYLMSECGFAADKIIFSGDSAGGHLVLTLLRYLSEHGKEAGLPNPVCAWGWSPWSSPRVPYNDDGTFERSPFSRDDYVGVTFGKWGSTGLKPADGTGYTLDSPYLNYVGHPFQTDVPLWIQYGGHEVLVHDGVKMSEELRLVEGNKVDVAISKDAVHDIVLIGHLLGFEERAQEAAVLANEFLRKQTVAVGST